MFNIKKSSAILSMALITAFSTNSEALITGDISDSNGDANTVQISAGDSFSLNISITSTLENSTGISYRFQISTVGDVLNPGSGKFSISSRVNGTSFPDLTVQDNVALTAPNALLDPSNNSDLGGTRNTGSNGIGTFLVATFNFSTLATLPTGTYNLSFTSDSSVGTDDFQDLTIADTYVITVIPEPTTIATSIFGFGLVAYGLRRSRSKQV